MLEDPVRAPPRLPLPFSWMFALLLTALSTFSQLSLLFFRSKQMAASHHL
uniref:Uncharacterized protein n=1 Tax=Arundo donax TaxID=35708 RepID=A0A0A9D3Y4_ARUDO